MNLLSRLPHLSSWLQEAHTHFSANDAEKVLPSPAAEWILDNFYVIQQNLRQIGQDLPERYYKQLPKLSDGTGQAGEMSLRGFPRIYALAHAYLLHEARQLDTERLLRFVEAYQQVTPLTMGEVWALPTMLRLALIEGLATAAAQLAHLSASVDVDIPLDERLNADEIVARSVPSLRVVDSEDWEEFFESTNLVHQTLCADPVGIYMHMDFATRNHYRTVIEHLARWTGSEELKIAQEVLNLARVACRHHGINNGHVFAEESSSWANLPRECHIGYYLLDQGRQQLEEIIRYRAQGMKALQRWVLRHPTGTYLGGVVFFTLIFMAVALWYAVAVGVGPFLFLVTIVLTVIPASTLAIHALNSLLTRLLPPRVLPKLDFEDGVPEFFRTMVVVPALLSSSADVDSLCQQLELHYLRSSNFKSSTGAETEGQLTYALLTDFSDAPRETMPEDDEIMRAATEAVDSLNKKYPRRPFYLFHRKRLWNPSEKVWMGWERKRGKLHEINRYLRGEQETSFTTCVGNVRSLNNIRYIITLDADTVLPRGEAQRLIATLAHPLNRAQFDEKGKVVAGYTILQPRTEIKPTETHKSIFTRVFGGDTGFDLYTRAVSDVYQDLFGEGIFVGKGIYDIDAFERSLAGRVPENHILSHDLFEGIHGRSGLVTDIVLYEDYPPHYLVNVLRSHRWIRGDWQLLPWLFPQVPASDSEREVKSIPNDLSLISRWKIFDNLRRSLFSPLLLVFFVAGWTILPGATWIWTLLAVMAPSTSLVTSSLTGSLSLIRGDDPVGVAGDLRDHAIRWLLFIAFLPYEALLTLDAIATTLVRLYVRRRRLLQWVTAARTVRLFGDEMTAATTLWKMLPSLLLTISLFFLLLWANPTALPIAAPFLGAWLLAWQIAHYISLPTHVETKPLTAEQRQKMRELARRTWLFYEHFVGPEDNWLPPDHFQENPRGVVAHRTSPTNVGMYLLTVLAAHDLGYIGAMDLTARLRSTFETLRRLERYRGHFLNWIDTRSLTSLPPAYVSTVDSGNLAGAFIALKQGCLNVAEEPVWDWRRWQGLLDLLPLLAGASRRVAPDAENPLIEYLDNVRLRILEVQHDPTRWEPLLQQLFHTMRKTINEHLITQAGSGSGDADRAAPINTEVLHACRVYSERIHHHLEDMRRDAATLLPWLPLIEQPPELFQISDDQSRVGELWGALQNDLQNSLRLGDLPVISKKFNRLASELFSALDEDSTEPEPIAAARDWCSRLLAEVQKGADAATQLIDNLNNLANDADAFLVDMDFTFLFNEHRQVFHIGYNIDTGVLDNNFYDLLASEARIASFIAIAKLDVPQSHWLHLARPITQVVNGERVLLSWSGTMFEYLMPNLLMHSYPNTLLDQSCRASVERQIEIGHQHKVPWGISESGFYTFDAALNYQYRAFGAPGLGFKRGLEEDLVIAPYASLLAISYRPQAVWQNLMDFEALGMVGQYGLYEAIDFTPSRLNLGQEHAIVRSYMAHHQGMILLALLNYLDNESMVDRLHADPRIQSIDLLLQEAPPAQAPLQFPHQEKSQPVAAETTATPINPWNAGVDTPMPLVHFLSNGRYGLLITNAGGGYSRWNEVQLTRWRSDTTLDDWGSWIYLQEIDADARAHPLWSASRQPTGVRPEHEEVVFHPHMVEFRRRDGGITLHTEVIVESTNDVEIRRVTLTNDTDRLRRLRLTSYGEVVLGSGAGDERHQSFAKLFIESEYVPDDNALLFRRRPRSADEKSYVLVHALVAESLQNLTRAHESDRAAFIGRGCSARCPRELADQQNWLEGHTGATLDPIMALGQEVNLLPHATVQIVLVYSIAETRQEALAHVRRLQERGTINRVFEEARTAAHNELRELDLTGSRLETTQLLLSLLLYPHFVRRAAPEMLAANSKGQTGLWAFGISGDYPILLLRIHTESEGELLQEILAAHRYWRRRKLQIDLVILNRQSTNYGQPVQSFVQRTISRMDSNQWLNQRGGIFVLREDQLTEADRILLHATARVVLEDRDGDLATQLAGILNMPTRLPLFEPSVDQVREGERAERDQSVVRPSDLQFDNGFGGFSADGREYCIYLQPGETTPAPWINVMANPEFGCLVSESGGGYTWAINSGENRLTSWRNDPVIDCPSEVLYLRDEETADIWTPTPQPVPAATPYLVRHGAGYSVFEQHSHDLRQFVHIFVAPDAPVKVVHLRLENASARQRRLTATYYAEWVLGVNRSQSSQYIVTEYAKDVSALLATNPYSADFGKRVAFVASSREPLSVTANRTEFLGRMGSLERPAALERIGLSGQVKPGIDPCAALQVHLDLPPHGEEEIYFLVGQGADRDAAIDLVKRFGEPQHVDATWRAAHDFWDQILGAVVVETPDPALNLLLNRWLLYQALSCRIWGRSALYQSSGAYGFRDQLQDVMALLHSRPDIAREQILRAARHQFVEGDVLHWWHPPEGQGVRTRITDDLLWLPYVTAHYVKVTGDEAILQEAVPFLQGEPLADDEEERYAKYGTTSQNYSLFEHCCRAIQKGTTAGMNGLPLMGAGDWNDGMNRVGIHGRGESVWLAWFLYITLSEFAHLGEQQQDLRAEHWREQAASLLHALEANGWDGEWYRRAYYDDGTPLGSKQNRECRIDSIAQSWSVLSGAADSNRARSAMQSVLERLVRWDDRLILLFTPPFNQTDKDPGYIKGYLPGIRENGGQYTHAALWTIWAFTQLGEGDTAGALFRLINPILRADTQPKAEHYKVEPYVISADVYGVDPHRGRGGWTWYTGSSGWMYRLGIEAILGLQRVASGLMIQPQIPQDWSGFQATYRSGDSVCHIEVKRRSQEDLTPTQVFVDGAEVTDGIIPLHADGTHEVQVWLGGEK